MKHSLNTKYVSGTIKQTGDTKMNKIWLNLGLCLWRVHIQLTPICLAGPKDSIRMHALIHSAYVIGQQTWAKCSIISSYTCPVLVPFQSFRGQAYQCSLTLLFLLVASYRNLSYSQALLRFFNEFHLPGLENSMKGLRNVANNGVELGGNLWVSWVHHTLACEAFKPKQRASEEPTDPSTNRHILNQAHLFTCNHIGSENYRQIDAQLASGYFYEATVLICQLLFWKDKNKIFE